MVKVAARMEGNIELLGYSVSKRTLSPGMSFSITWFWRANAAVEQEWSFFTHLVDARGNLISSQNNRGALRSRFGPATWPTGKIVADTEPVVVPSTWNSPVIELRTGLWRGNERISVSSGPSDEEDRIKGPSLEVQLRAVPVAAAATADAAVEVVFAQKPPVIDGSFEEEACWSSAAVLKAFSQSVSGAPVGDGTEVRLMYDDRNLYIAMKAQDSEIQTPFKTSDEALWRADAVEIFLRPDPALPVYYDFQISPTGVVYDARLSTYRDADTSFRSGIRVKTALTGIANDGIAEDTFWSAEIAIPLKSLGVDGKALESSHAPWTGNFFRIDKGNGVENFSAWSAPMRGDFHALNRFGRIRFSTAADSR